MSRIYTLDEIKAKLRYHVKSKYRTKGNFTDDSVENFANFMGCSKSMVYEAMNPNSTKKPTESMLNDLGYVACKGYVKK